MNDQPPPSGGTPQLHRRNPNERTSNRSTHMSEMRTHLHRAPGPFPQRQQHAHLPRLRNTGSPRNDGHQHRGAGQDPRNHPRQVHSRIRGAQRAVWGFTALRRLFVGRIPVATRRVCARSGGLCICTCSYR